MEIYTNLQPHDCLERIEYLLESGSEAEKVTTNLKYCFRDGATRMVSEVNGIEFSLAILGRGKYGSVDHVGRFRGHVAQSSHGGSVIAGKFTLCGAHITILVLLAIMSGFPPAMMMFKSLSVASIGRDTLLMWYACMGVFLITFISGFIHSRRLLSDFLCDLLEATPE